MSDAAVAAVPRIVTPWRVFLATLTVAATAIAFLLLYVFRSVVFYLFIGVVVATALMPLVNWLKSRNVAQRAATVGVYLAVVLALLTALVVGLPLVFSQASTLAETLPQNYPQLRESIAKSPNRLMQRLAARLPENLTADPPVVKAEEAVGNVARALSYTDWVYQAVFAVVSVTLIAFYWTLQEERTIRALQLFLPANRREPAREFIDAIQAKLGAYIRGQGILCLVVGGMTFVALLAIGIPYATTLAIIAGILEAVPVFGPALGAVPPILLAVTTDPDKALWVIGAAFVIQQTENYLLVPRVMDRSVGVNPVVTLLGIAAFGSLMGLPGAILAIPLSAIAQLVLDRALLDPQALEPPQPLGRDAASVARYHAQQLVHDVRVYLRTKEDAPTRRNDSIEEAIESIALDLDKQLGAIELAPAHAAAAPGAAT